ncbi:TPA: hypothetical protein DCW38_06750 [candidate division WOR-3 bacterium]|uniref:Nucleotidyl transferase domain-containing protein n=1 Tax=candidate division WOR-3 bacterium TaxID=2052148 RepID=A0A350HBE6_UNCW3|nr:hypothetical protein [candidate division WOR-3 bacterium]
MNYIILAAGMGTRLKPFTNNFPKCLVNIGNQETIVERCVRLIRKHDKTAEITIVVGFKKESIMEKFTDINFICNPFYEFTNSIVSLWFARNLLNKETVVINGDIVFSEELAKILVKKPTKPHIFMDSSIKKDGDYNVQIDEGKVVVMSKELDEYSGEYAGITKLDKNTAVKLKKELEDFIDKGYFKQWYEDVLVHMILDIDFELFYEDIANYSWTELDSISQLLFTKKIHRMEQEHE